MTDKEFKLYLRKVLQEQLPAEEEYEEVPDQQQMPQGQQQMPQDQSMGLDPYSQQGIAMDPNAGMLMPGQIQPVDKTEIGKIYELSRLYSRLVAINNVLQYLADPKLDDMKYKVAEALDLFNVIISRYDDFNSSVGKITDKYTNFIMKITDEIDKVRKDLPEEFDEE
jgi:hypothetical protein